MNILFSSWLVIVLAILSANLSFVSERLFGVIPLKIKQKAFGVHLVEIFVFYVLTGMCAYFLELHVGNVFTQTWEFYVITFCFFIVLAFPGAIFRYLWKRLEG